MSQKIRLGIIGGGMMSQVGHIPFFLSDHRCKVTAIAEPRPSLQEYIRSHFNFENIVNSYSDVLESDDVDAVVLSVPRGSTGPISLECLEAKKHLLAEKPMAHTLDQTQVLVDAARKSDLIYGVGYMKRYDPGIVRARNVFEDLLESKRLGNLLYARFYDHSKAYAFKPPEHCRPQESRSDRFEEWPTHPSWLPANLQNAFAWFMNSASHDVNLINYFFKTTPKVVKSAVFENMSVSATLASEGVPIGFDISPAMTGRWTEGGEFIFENGRLAFELPSPMNSAGVTSVQLYENASYGTVGDVVTDTGWSFYLQARGFVDALVGSAPFATPGEAVLRDMELIEEMWRAAM